jgi:predicted nucleotidyltransferase
MAVTTKDEVFKLLRQSGAQLRRFGVRRLSVFGSFARGEPKDESDVDLLVEFDPDEKTFDNLLGLADFLEEFFGRKVDIVTPESLNPHFGHHILNEAEYAAVDA